MANKTTSGMNIFGWLFLAFVVLKLCGVIDWSWWWVTSPIWGLALVAFVIVIIYQAITGKRFPRQ